MSDEEAPPAAEPVASAESTVELNEMQMQALAVHIASLVKGILVTVPGHFLMYAAFLEARERKLMLTDHKLYDREGPIIRNSIKACRAMARVQAELKDIYEGPKIAGPTPAAGNNGRRGGGGLIIT